jgi:hypothetical protein
VRIALDPVATVSQSNRHDRGTGGSDLLDQKVVDAIRSTGDDNLIFVARLSVVGTRGWAEASRARIDDPADNFMFDKSLPRLIRSWYK